MNTPNLFLCIGILAVILIIWRQVLQLHQQYIYSEIFELDLELDDLGIRLYNMEQNPVLFNRPAYDELSDRVEWCEKRAKQLKDKLQRLERSS